MRRGVSLILVMSLILLLSVGAGATGASRIESSSTVASDGSCQVTLTALLHLEQAVEDLSFPLPAGATDIRVNGSTPSTSRSGGVVNADLSRIFGAATGDLTVTFVYTLPGNVAYNDIGRLILTLPLLSGFAYPVEEMRFTVTLPSEITAKPAFSSGYFQSSIEEDLEVTVDGRQITGSLTKPLKDRETLTMTLEVSPEAFPQQDVPAWSVNLDDIAMIVSAAAAVLYWLVFLRCLPPRRISHSAPPDGISAGEVGSVLTMQGTDLTMLVLHWAQLGYILIHLDDNGRVLLHKRMDMGNERSSYELRIFRSLFGKRKMIDGTGFQYARLYRKVAAGEPRIRGLYRRKSGNPTLFRVLAALVGLFGGISLANALTAEGTYRSVFLVLLALFGVISAWFIQAGGQCLHLRNKGRLWVALGLCVLWLILGAAAGELNVAVCVALGELLAGLAAFYGGKRTELGKQSIQQVLGLRRYMTTVSGKELRRILRSNPNYFFDLAPYALAMGVDQRFARNFGSQRLPRCPYLTTGMDGHMTAREWSRVLRDAVNTLDARQNQLPLERLFGR